MTSPFIIALAMVIPMTMIHLTECFLILYPAPMIAIMTSLKGAWLAFIALL